MRRLAVHSTELPSITGNCIILDNSDNDMLEVPCLLSALDFIQHEVPPQQPIEKWELAVIGHLAG